MTKTGFHLAGDLVWIHGRRGATDGKHRPPGGVRDAFKSLPAAVFMLAYAAGDSIVTQASRRNQILGGTAGRTPLGLGSSGLVDAWAARCPLMARARITPRGSTSIHPWRLLDGAELDAYLTDARLLRNKLAHTGGTEDAPLRSPFFVKDGQSGLTSMTLMLAEGLLQATQDIAYLTLSAAMPAVPDRADWEWVLPRQSATGWMPERLWRHEAFPLPSRSA
jgi:hypothetical protein